MATERQIEANRENSRKSTGPRTAKGKAAVRLNAVKHGLTAQQVILGDEAPEDYEAFRAYWLEDLTPHGAREEGLAERVITAAWRLRRVPRAEQDLFAGGGASAPFRFGTGTDKIARYDAALDRAFYRALQKLEKLQAVRAEETAAGAAPAAGPEAARLSDGAG